MIGTRSIGKRARDSDDDEVTPRKRHQHHQGKYSSSSSGKNNKKRETPPDDIEDYMRTIAPPKKKSKHNNTTPSPFNLKDIMGSDADSCQSSDSEDERRRNRNKQTKRERDTISQTKPQRTIFLGDYRPPPPPPSLREEYDDDDDNDEDYDSSSSNNNGKLIIPVGSGANKNNMLTMPNLFDYCNPFDRDDDDDEEDIGSGGDREDEEGDDCEEDFIGQRGGSVGTGGGDGEEAMEDNGEEVWNRTASPYMKQLEALGPLIEGAECPGCIYINPNSAKSEKNWRELNKIYVEESQWKSPFEVAIQQSHFYEQRIRKGNPKIPVWTARMIFEHNHYHVTDDSTFLMQCKSKLQGLIREYHDQNVYVTNGKQVMLDSSREMMSGLKGLYDMYHRCLKSYQEQGPRGGGGNTSVKTIIRQSGINATRFLM